MAKRKAYAPFSLTSEAGVSQTPVEGYIDVEQKVYPVISTGVVNEFGQWTGVVANDKAFIELQIDEMTKLIRKEVTKLIKEEYGYIE